MNSSNVQRKSGKFVFGMRNGLSKQSSLLPIWQWVLERSRFEHSKTVNGIMVVVLFHFCSNEITPQRMRVVHVEIDEFGLLNALLFLTQGKGQHPELIGNVHFVKLIE